MDLIEKAAKRLEKEKQQTTALEKAVPEKIAEKTEAHNSEQFFDDFGDLGTPPAQSNQQRQVPNVEFIEDSPEASRHIDISLEVLKERGMVTPDQARTQISEEFRHIKRPLLRNVDRRGTDSNEKSNLIMVTSGRPNEGKTFSAINLALSCAAEQDRTVLLVDADVVKPSVGEFFDIPGTDGLVDYLVKEEELSELICQTSIPNLKILPAGNPHNLSTELFGSEKMRDLMNSLSQKYSDRVVIFDSPPLLATSEASVLASLMGQIVVVVEAEKTTKSEIQESLSQVAGNDDIAIGFVLNKARHVRSRGYYGYYGY